MMAAWKLAPALAAGCTLVLKPAEQTPLTALKLAEILHEINELPKGVVNNEAEAIKIANHSPYGLAAGVWTKDFPKAMRLVRKIRAGMIRVNHYHPTPMEGPWGGFKQSDLGRELGLYGIENYLQPKQVYINLQQKPLTWY